jgi:opacity protein-like surface antigen
MPAMVRRARALALLLSLAVAVAAAGPASAAPLYLRLGAGYEGSADTTVLDRDCVSTEPPALFGCVDGPDGRRLAARGDFGETEAFDLGVGWELSPRLRAELALVSRPGLGLDAEANFLDVTEAQPVSADAESLAGIVVLSYELGPPSWRARPFVAAGAGAARNEIGPITYAFPGIGREAVTITRGGSHTDFAWTASAGLAIPVGERLAVDLAIRYSDLGEVRTDDGEATIVRPNRTFSLDIAGTRADLETLGAGVSLRYRF